MQEGKEIMKIAVLSDIHDNVWNLETALKGVQETEAMIVCGDLCSPFIVGLLGKGYPGRPVYLLFGNNDADTFRITRSAAQFPNIQIQAEFLEIELGGRRIAAVHYDNMAGPLADSGRYEAVFYGHNHRCDICHTGGALLANPGAVMGWSPSEPEGQRDIAATYLIYDTQSHQAAAYKIERPG